MNNLHIFDDKEAAIRDLAEHWCRWSARRDGDRRGFHVALAGGSTPQALYQLLTTSDYVERMAWEKNCFFFSDERCVARDHADSNYRMARLALFDHVPIDMSHVFPMRGDAADLHKAAAEYERAIRKTVPDKDGIPCFDLVLLGMGDDGHTASLFPGTTALAERDRLVVPVFVPKFNAWRLTFTYPLINQATRVVILVTGAAKAGIVAEVINGGGELRYPIQGVTSGGELIWYLDRAAAAQLE